MDMPKAGLFSIVPSFEQFALQYQWLHDRHHPANFFALYVRMLPKQHSRTKYSTMLLCCICLYLYQTLNYHTIRTTSILTPQIFQKNPPRNKELYYL